DVQMMTYRIMDFNVTLVGTQKAGEREIFPREQDEKPVRHEIISEVETDANIVLTEFLIPKEEQSAVLHANESNGIVGVFDVSSQESFEILSTFLSNAVSEPMKGGNLLVIGWDSGNEPPEVPVEAISGLTNRTGALYLEASQEFRKGLDIMMRRFASNLIRYSEK
ncbi:MAG: hypothetical protein P1Q69_17200, partial [Candidatus Thorarchaeota archaeon]|nr:hypothetical protein [Candidatus Thorarchaeota archaeon]